jgi:hypothetical protein
LDWLNLLLLLRFQRVQRVLRHHNRCGLLERFVMIDGRLWWNDFTQSQRLGSSHDIEHL